MKTLNELRNEIHANAIEKGFYDNPREVGTSLMLIVSELAEALEADREGFYCGGFNRYEKCKKGEFELKHKQETDVRYMPRSPLLIKSADKIKIDAFEMYIKNTFEDELADTVIRVLDLCGYLNIDIERHVKMKMKYNKLREKLYWKKY